MTELETVKAYLALATQLFRATCGASELDTANTKITVRSESNPEVNVSKSLDELFAIWEAAAQ